jgi:hypothetical protein
MQKMRNLKRQCPRKNLPGTTPALGNRKIPYSELPYRKSQNWASDCMGMKLS